MTKKHNLTFDGEIEHILMSMKSLSPTSEEYGIAVGNLKELCEARSKRASHFIDWNIIAGAAIAILQTWMILNHEQLNVISTKALGLAARIRI